MIFYYNEAIGFNPKTKNSCVFVSLCLCVKVWVLLLSGRILNRWIRYHAVTHLDGVQKFWYDENGNQIKRIVGSDTYDPLTYDNENHLVAVQKNGDPDFASFVYGPGGERVMGTVDGITTLYVGAFFEKIVSGLEAGTAGAAVGFAAGTAGYAVSPANVAETLFGATGLLTTAAADARNGIPVTLGCNSKGYRTVTMGSDTFVSVIGTIAGAADPEAFSDTFINFMVTEYGLLRLYSDLGVLADGVLPILPSYQVELTTPYQCPPDQENP